MKTSQFGGFWENTHDFDVFGNRNRCKSTCSPGQIDVDLLLAPAFQLLMVQLQFKLLGMRHDCPRPRPSSGKKCVLKSLHNWTYWTSDDGSSSIKSHTFLIAIQLYISLENCWFDSLTPLFLCLPTSPTLISFVNCHHQPLWTISNHWSLLASSFIPLLRTVNHFHPISFQYTPNVILI